MPVSNAGFAAIAALTLAISGCASTPPTNQAVDPAVVAFNDAPIRIAADRVNVTVESRSFAVGAPGEVEFLVSPEQIARLWPQKRLRATGGDAAVRYIIRNVGVTSNKTPTGDEVTAVISVRMVMPGSPPAKTEVAVESSTRFNNGASPMGRWQATATRSRDLAAKLDRELTEAVWQDFAGYVSPSAAELADVPPAVRPVRSAATQPVPLAPQTPAPSYIVEEAPAPRAPEVVYIQQAVAPPPRVAVQPVEIALPDVSFERPAAPVVSETTRPYQAPAASQVILPEPTPTPTSNVKKAAAQPAPPPVAPKATVQAEKKPETPSVFGGGDLTKGMFLPGSSSFPALPK